MYIRASLAQVSTDYFQSTVCIVGFHSQLEVKYSLYLTSRLYKNLGCQTLTFSPQTYIISFLGKMLPWNIQYKFTTFAT